LLHERFQALGGDAAKGLIFLPCELIEHNGRSLQQAILRHAEAWNLSADFREWLSHANCFLNTLVDRIVPGYPRDEAAALAEEFGYEDKLLDSGELFHLWVIEGPRHLAEELPLDRAGLNVVWTDDLAPYRTRKVRILNGAHTSTVLAAFLAGIDTVGQMMDDATFGGLVRKAVFEEILPTVPLADHEKTQYAEAVLDRFRNPFIRHELLSISLNSVSKWRVRVLPSLQDYLRQKKSLPPALAFSLAALIRFYDGVSLDGVAVQGSRGGATYPIRDEPSVLAAFRQAWANYREKLDTHRLATEVLANRLLWGDDLTGLPGFADAVAKGLDAILSRGIHAAVESVVQGEPS
jgi:tagaturonate reductase